MVHPVSFQQGSVYESLMAFIQCDDDVIGKLIFLIICLTISHKLIIVPPVESVNAGKLLCATFGSKQFCSVQQLTSSLIKSIDKFRECLLILWLFTLHRHYSELN